MPLNAVEREPVSTRVLNPNASQASYKPKQRSYRKTKLERIIFLFTIFFGGILSGNPPDQPNEINKQINTMVNVRCGGNKVFKFLDILCARGRSFLKQKAFVWNIDKRSYKIRLDFAQ